jgi:hypothetical protein
VGLEDTIRNEQSLMRKELQDLKRCQLQYFILTLAGTGVIFGLGDSFPRSDLIESVIYLSPIIIIIPCWFIFFDKATTITRLVGYMRYLENVLGSEEYVYIGYENALSKFRKEEKNNSPEDSIKLRDWKKWGKFISVLYPTVRHRYWIINWYTFFTLSVICCIIPFLAGVDIDPSSDKRSFFVLAAIVIVLFSSLLTFRIVAELIIGRYSYDRMAAFWGKVMKQRVLPS